MDVLHFHPRVPTAWETFKVDYRFGQTIYHLLFTQCQTHLGPLSLMVDGQSVQEGCLQLVDDRKEHAVEVLFAPGSMGLPQGGDTKSADTQGREAPRHGTSQEDPERRR
jgi:hypothetical protein